MGMAMKPDPFLASLLVGVDSRRELDTDKEAGKEWDSLMYAYQMGTGQLPEMR